jgi:hypothetical protein
MVPVFESTDDNVNGWMATIVFKQPIRYTPCNSPINEIDDSEDEEQIPELK